MRLSYAVLLALITVLGSTISIAAETTAVYLDHHHVHASSDELRGMRRTRLLRAEKETNDDEERTNLLKKIASVFKSKNSAKVVPIGTVKEMQLAPNLAKKFKKLMKSKSLDDAVTTLKLGGKVKPKVTELYQPDKLPMYVRFSEDTFARRGSVDKWGIETLRKNGYSEKDLLVISNHGFKNGDDVSTETAKRLRGGLLEKWFQEKKTANEVAQLLKAGEKTLTPANQAAYQNYLKAQNSQITGNPIAFNPLA
ncbi:Avirulence (Avh) protein [Phytophthora megakarya]|uniref:RxLR effector protein n=1 Tax=Phytophthora megakarya TaxID=4795 RepID=A0A225VZB9_9STRA|nr:Avirulence (Avh) protein [Phytophthora megakarya]